MSTKSPSLAQYFALSSMVSFPFLLSGRRASIFSLLNERLLSVSLVRATLTHLRAIQSGSKASSSGACSLNCFRVESAVKLCFSRNCSKTNTKLLALGFRVFEVDILVAMSILTVIYLYYVRKNSIRKNDILAYALPLKHFAN